MRTSQGLALTMLILGVDWHTTWKGSTRTLQGLPLTMLIQGVDWHTTWKGSMRTLQGLPLTMLIQGVNWHTTWKGSTRTLQGLPLTMLILGGVNRHTTWKGSVRTSQVLPLTMLIWGSINTQLGKVPWGHCKDYLWQCWSGVCVNQHTTWKGSMRTLQGLPLIMLILGGQLTHNLKRICKDIARITSDNVDPGGVNQHATWKGSMRTLQGLPLRMLILGFNWHTTWKGSTRTLQGLPLTMFILGGVNRHTTWKGSMRTLQGLPLTMLIWGLINTQLGKVPWGHCKDYLWHVDLGVCVNQHTTWKGSMRTLQGLPLIMLILGGQLTHNLKRIHKDIARIT